MFSFTLYCNTLNSLHCFFVTYILFVEGVKTVIEFGFRDIQNDQSLYKCYQSQSTWSRYLDRLSDIIKTSFNTTVY